MYRGWIAEISAFDHNVTVTAGIYRQARSGLSIPSHGELTAAVARIARQLSELAFGRRRPAAGAEEAERLLSVVLLAMVARRGLRPPAPLAPAAVSFLERLAAPATLLLDDSAFAAKLTGPAARSDWLAEAPALVPRLIDVFKQPQAQALLDDPLFPGWLYQALTRQPRARLTGVPSGASPQSATSGHVRPSALPALTRWFTPRWIADFLVEETLGSFLARRASGDRCPTFFDPACGAGHILVPALRRLAKQLMVDCVVPPAEALSAVLADRLFGADIDARVVELAGFALYLTARDLAPPVDLPLPRLFHFGSQSGNDDRTTALGSLWLGVDCTSQDVFVAGPRGVQNLSASGLDRTYSIVVTNPPFLGHRLIPPAVSDFLKNHYSAGRFDLYAAFLSLCLRLLENGGHTGIICQQSFMSITRYRHLREELLGACQITGLIQLGPGVFGPGTGEKTNNAIIIAAKTGPGPEAPPATDCWRILDRQDKEEAESNGIRSLPAQKMQVKDVAIISGAPLSFWCPPQIAGLFERYPPLESEESGVLCTNGLFTCNNHLFVRPHQDVPAEESGQWVPYDKGGGHKWYRTTPLMLRWQGDGRAIRDYRRRQGQSACLPGERFYFQQGVTYSYIGTRGFRARLLSPGSVFDIASSAVFSQRLDLNYVLAFLNSSLARFLLGVLNPTVNFQIGDLRKLPFKLPGQELERSLAAAAGQAVALARELDALDPASPLYGGPALLRYGSPEPGDSGLKNAYRELTRRLSEINESEVRIQALIDSLIFELYEIDARTQELICADPWVTRSQKPLATIPSFKACLHELERSRLPA